LKDYGSDLGFTPHISTSETDTSSLTRGFVKFFGEGSNRSERNISVIKEVQRSGSHWACSYPKGKRPRSVQDGDVIFIARLVQDPQDILIYGRAIGLAHLVGRDDATTADIALRQWKKKWPHYIRVREPEFVDGALANGVSLNDMMEKLGWAAFASTTRNHERGKGNTNPRKAFMRQAAVQLSSAGTAWLNDRLDKSLARYGRLSQADLAKLDWPEGTELSR